MSHSEPAHRFEAPDGVVSIGLTGGQAAGKTTALELFREAGAVVLSADDIVAALYRRPEVKAALHSRFGASVITPEGELDRAALRKAVSGQRALDWLDAYLHPKVGREVRRAIERTAPGTVVVVEVPLLFEAGMDDLFDLTVTIEAPVDVRRRRAAGRAGSGLFETLEGRQIASADRKEAAHLWFMNDGRPQDMAQFVAEVMDAARARLIGETRRISRDSKGT